MTTFRQWISGEGRRNYEEYSDFKWSVRDGLFVAIMLEILVIAMTLATSLIMGFLSSMFFAIGTCMASVLGYIRFAIQWKWFNPY